MAKILVIDDNAVNRDFLVTLLRYGGHDLSEAADGAEGVTAVETSRPDLVISDILMPVADGYEFVRQVRANPVVAATPVIFYTAAYHRREAEPLAAAATGVQFLAKPAEPEAILLMVNTALSGNLRATTPRPVDVEYDREHLRLLTDKLAQKVLELEREIVDRKDAEAARDAIAVDRAARIDAERNARLDAERSGRMEAERQSRIKDEFLATLSHELRTPLNAIVGWSQILAASRDQVDLDEGLEVIGRNARAQQRIIEDLLDMSRIVSAKVRLELQTTELSLVIRSAMGSVQHAADARGVRMDLSLESNDCSVTGDPGRLQQVFSNLLSNAIKFTPRGGSVRTTVEKHDGQIAVRVSDDGEGIAADFLPNVFDRFRQADGSTTRRHGGLGLGLAIVKQLVELHGGTVSADSAGRGHGSTFLVSLPLDHVAPDLLPGDACRPDPLRRVSGADSSGQPLIGMTVLVVDDEPDARGLVRRLLEDGGATVVTASSAVEGLSSLQLNRPNVLISDIGMPGEDGYAFIARLRHLSRDAGGSTPAIALTAYASSEDRAHAIRAGYQSHLAKPVDSRELIATVLRYVPAQQTHAMRQGQASARE